MDEMDILLGAIDDPLYLAATKLVNSTITMFNELAHIRVESGLTIQDVAKELTSSKTAIDNLENGYLDCTISTLRRYCLVIGAELEIKVTKRVD